MLRKLVCLALCLVSSSIPALASAQTAALLALGDGAQLSEVQLAKVVADDSSLWLSVRLRGRTRLALVTGESALESAPSAHAWLRALDYATRIRVAAPPGPLDGCTSLQPFEPDDTGLPEPHSVSAFEISSQDSELELRRRLADAGLSVDIDSVARFTNAAQPPFRVVLYDVPAAGGSTEAVRLIDRGHPTTLPLISLSGASASPLSLIALVTNGVQPQAGASADPSEFPVVYHAADASADYLAARGEWLAQNPSRWLNEAELSGALFTGTQLPSGDRIEPAMVRYFGALPQEAAGACQARVRAAHERGSMIAQDFVCGEADDLARSLAEVGFAELRASRFFGQIARGGADFRVAVAGSRSPLLSATDFDPSGCPQEVLPPVNVPTNPPPSPPQASTTPIVVSGPDDPYYDPPPAPTTVAYTEGSCTGSTTTARPNDSCSGDSSTSDSSRDACSGDSSTSDSSGDSCSGDSSSQESSSDSCSGDSSDSKYDGDTCSGNSAKGNSTGTKAEALHADSTRAKLHPRPRPVRLSLLTLLAAAMALPLRRLSASR